MANQDTQQLDQQLRQLFGAHTYSEGPLAVSGAGRRFVGLDLCHPLNLDQVTFILDALSQFRIISIAGQDLTAFSLAHFERFANHWGAPVPHPNNFLRGGKSAQSDGDSDGEFELIQMETDPPKLGVVGRGTQILSTSRYRFMSLCSWFITHLWHGRQRAETGSMLPTHLARILKVVATN